MNLSLSQLAAHAAGALGPIDDPQVLAYAWPEAWSGGATIVVAGRTLPLRYCASALEVREALCEASDSSRMLLVNVPEHRLGQDVLARVFRHRLLHVDRWQLVQQAYAVRQVDPRLYRLSWIPDLLLDAAASKRRNASPVLTFADAMAACLSFEFGIPLVDELDLASWAVICDTRTSRWASIARERRDAYREYLAAQLGPLAEAFIAAMEHGGDGAILAIGLACEVLYTAEGGDSRVVRDARIRIESHLGNCRLSTADGFRWAELAIGLLAKHEPAARHSADQKATNLLRTLGAGDFLAMSSVLTAGLDARLVALGKVLDRVLKAKATVAEVDTAVAYVAAHTIQSADHPGVEAAYMAARLCRSLAVAVATNRGDWAIGYLQHGAWQDWARRSLRGVRPEPFAQAVSHLLDRIASVRRDQDEAFASALISAIRIGDVPRGFTPIECMLDEVLVPLAQREPVLLVLLDGMSADVALAIGQALPDRGWQPWERGDAPHALLATVPSVTEFSRASLFAGRLAAGDAAMETRWFAEHAALRHACHAGKPPLLFHKAGIEHHHQLSGEVMAAVAGPENQVVGVVINAIDDTLAKSEQIRIDWNVETIPLLAELLECARVAGRAVVLTSDHGHVLERGSKLRSGGPGERYRLPGQPVGDGEILAGGPRIRTLVDGDVVVPWREDIRYAAKKNGYHGGVTQQEMVVPLQIWSPARVRLPEQHYRLATTVPPAWWAATARTIVRPAEHKPETAAGRERAMRAERDLFATPTRTDLAERLVGSEALGAQQKRLGRIALPNERLAALVRQLDVGGGRANLDELARATGSPVLRMRGAVAVLERTLNVDGFPVIRFEPATETVMLDRGLLEKQFAL